MPLLTPPQISSGGIIPQEPPPYKRGPFASRMPSGGAPGLSARFRPAPPGEGEQVLSRLQVQNDAAVPVSRDSISASGLQGRARAKRLMDEVYEGEGGYDPKLAQIEEGEKDLAVQGLQEAKELSQPTSSPRPVRRWRDELAQEQANQGRERLMGELGGIEEKQRALEEMLTQEVMGSPEYAAAPDEEKLRLVASARQQAQQHALDLERRYLAVGSLSAGKGLPTTAFPRP